MKIRWPVDPNKFPISQFWMERPEVYKRFGLAGHNGLDQSGKIDGEQVNACDKGKVLQNTTDPQGFGIYVKIKHDWGESLYAHLKEAWPPVGMEVEVGQGIGRVDNTGFSTGSHLHFGIRVNPYDLNDGMRGYSDPLPYLKASDTLEVNENLKKENEGLKNQILDLKGQIISMADTISKIQKEDTTALDNELKAERERDEALKQVKDLKEEIVLYVGTETELRKELEEAHTAYNRLKADLGASESQIKDISKEYKTFLQNIEDFVYKRIPKSFWDKIIKFFKGRK